MFLYVLVCFGMFWVCSRMLWYVLGPLAHESLEVLFLALLTAYTLAHTVLYNAPSMKINEQLLNIFGNQ